MLFLGTLIFTAAAALLLHRAIRALPVLFYLLAAASAAALFSAYFLTDYSTWPHWFTNSVAFAYARGTISTALFVIVMYLGALPVQFPGVSPLLPIRGELSIIACIFAFAHAVYYGIYYFPHLLFEPHELEWPYILATLLTIAMIVIAVPLMITSFRGVRKRMEAARWKRLQWWAYPFYGLLYAHIILVKGQAIYRDLINPHDLAPDIIQSEIREDITAVAVYTVLFAAYLVLRLKKRSLSREAGVP